MLRQEAEAWDRIDGLVESMTSDELILPGYTAEGWSAKDMMAHVAAWSNYAARILDEIAAGTWSGHEPTDEPGGTDRLNAEWFERDRALDLDTVRSSWRSARERLLGSFGRLEEITPGADEWFEESGPAHYTDHLRDLERWTARLRAEG